MADHPFSNAGLGMFGTAERGFAQAGMRPPEIDPKKNGLGALLAGFLKDAFPDKQSEQNPAQTSTAGVAPPQFSPATNFPEVFNQQYVTPWKPGFSPAVPPTFPTSLQGFVAPPQYGVPAANPMQAFKTTPNYFAQQPGVTQTPSLNIVEQLWKK